MRTHMIKTSDLADRLPTTNGDLPVKNDGQPHNREPHNIHESN